MAAKNKVTAKPPILQTGAHGYLLWLRRDLPPVYSAIAKQVPAVAAFESALQRQAAGLGQDTLDTDDVDESGIFTIDPGSIDEPAPVVITSDFADPVITMPALDVPTVNIPSDSSGAAGAAASGISGATLSSIANAVTTILPAALKTATAVVNAQTASKTLATAQLQYAAALAGKSPLRTGIVTTGNGTQYLSALSSTAEFSDIGDTLETQIAGLPLWGWLAAGLGALLLIVNTVED